MHSCMTDTPCKTPVLWLCQPAVEAVVIGPFGIECLGVGVCVQFKKIFRYILICIFRLFVFFVLAVPHLNVFDSVVLHYCRESLDVTMNKLLDCDRGTCGLGSYV